MSLNFGILSILHRDILRRLLPLRGRYEDAGLCRYLNTCMQLIRKRKLNIPYYTVCRVPAYTAGPWYTVGKYRTVALYDSCDWSVGAGIVSKSRAAVIKRKLYARSVGNGLK